MGLAERKWGSWGIRSMSVFYVVSGLERVGVGRFEVVGLMS